MPNRCCSQCRKLLYMLTWTVAEGIEQGNPSETTSRSRQTNVHYTRITLSSQQNRARLLSVQASIPTSACFVARINTPSEACCSCWARCDCACGVVSLPVDAPPLSVYKPPLGATCPEGCGDMRCVVLIARCARAWASGLRSIMACSPRCGEGSGDGRHCSG